jgi:hypothetical protein
MPPRRFLDCWLAAGWLDRLIGVIHKVEFALPTLVDREAAIRDVEVVFNDGPLTGRLRAERWLDRERAGVMSDV